MKVYGNQNLGREWRISIIPQLEIGHYGAWVGHAYCLTIGWLIWGLTLQWDIGGRDE